MNTDDEESSGGVESEDDTSDSEPEEDLQAKIDACSDDEAKEELREAQLRKMMEDSQARLVVSWRSALCSDIIWPLPACRFIMDKT